MKTSAETDPTEVHVTIKLGSDAHAKWFYLAQQVDRLLCFFAKQQRQQIVRERQRIQSMGRSLLASHGSMSPASDEEAA